MDPFPDMQRPGNAAARFAAQPHGCYARFLGAAAVTVPRGAAAILEPTASMRWAPQPAPWPERSLAVLARQIGNARKDTLRAANERAPPDRSLADAKAAENLTEQIF